jgi:arsenate reductase-like glutaredoxin family protein
MADKNPITGDLLQSRMNSKEFEENFDRIFRQRINDQKLNNDDMMTHEQMVSKMLENPKVLAEYELNKSTGEVQKVDNGKDVTNSTKSS